MGRILLLYRTLDLPEDAGARLGEVQRDIAVAAAYFEDKLARGRAALLCGAEWRRQEFARWIVNDAEIEVVELAARPTTGAATPLGKLSFAGMAGALAGAA